MYVRLNRSYGFGDEVEYGEGAGDRSRLSIYTPNGEVPDDPYIIYLWADWVSEDFDSPLQASSVIQVQSSSPITLESPFTVDFYDE